MKYSNNITDTEKEILSYNSYHLDNPIKLDGWQMVYKEPETKNGFEGQIYQKGNNVVVYKGTNQTKDFLNSDIPMGTGYSPKQQEDAHNLFVKAQAMYKDKNVNIEVTGHSLGGSMAQIESARTGVQATTFNAYGTGKILKLEGYNSQQIQNMNVKNYGNPKDYVFVSNIENQPGRTYATNTTLDNDKVYGVNRDYSSLTYLKKYHDIEKMDRLEDAVEVTPRTRNQDLQNLYHGYVYKMDDIYKDVNNPNFNNIPMAIPESLRQPSGVPTGQAVNFDINQLANILGIQLPEVQPTNQPQKNSGLFGYTNPLTGSNHIYIREEVGAMSSDEFAKHEKEIDAQTRAFN